MAGRAGSLIEALLTGAQIQRVLAGFRNEVLEIVIQPVAQQFRVCLAAKPVVWHCRSDTWQVIYPRRAADGGGSASSPDTLSEDSAPPMPDLTMSGSPGAWLAWLLRRDRSRLQMSGDLALATRMQQTLEQSELDWTLLLEPFMGEELRAELKQRSARFGAWGQDVRERVSVALRDALQHEYAFLPARKAVQPWLGEVENLRRDCDRLEARLRRLETRLEGRVKAENTSAVVKSHSETPANAIRTAKSDKGADHHASGFRKRKL